MVLLLFSRIEDVHDVFLDNTRARTWRAMSIYGLSWEEEVFLEGKSGKKRPNTVRLSVTGVFCIGLQEVPGAARRALDAVLCRYFVLLRKM